MELGLDLYIIIAYLILIIGIGWWVSRTKENSSDYFLAGRNMGWWAIGASLFASNISSEHFIGLAGSGASSGLAVGQFEWLAAFALLLLAWVFVPFYISSKVFTVPEFLEKRFDSRSRTYLATVSIVAYILTKISVTLYAGGIVLKAVFGWDMMASAIILVVITGFYTIIGGLKAVIYTEVAQTIILIGGAVTLTVLGLVEVGGWSGMSARVDPEFFNIWKSMDDPNIPWTGILFGAPILGIWYWCTDQFIVQRVLSARNIPQAQGGAIFAGFLKILPVFIMVLPGVIAHAINPNINGDEAYPWLINTILPVGVKGVVMASLLAALMSSLASCFNSASTLFTIDFYKKKYPQVTEERLLKIGKYSTLVLVLLGMLWVPFIQYISSQVYIYMQSVQAYISPPIAAVFLMGIFWQRMNAHGAFAGLIGGFFLGFFRLIGELFHFDLGVFNWFISMNFLHFAIFLFITSLIIQAVVSLTTEKPNYQTISSLTWSGRKQGISNLTLGLNEKWNIAASVVLVGFIFYLWIIFS